MMPTKALWAAPIALMTLLGGCAAEHYISAGYATVPIQLVVLRQGKYEILDRPELGRLVISPSADRATQLAAVDGFIDKALGLWPAATNSTTSPGSAYFDPLMEYFAQTRRSCRLIQGVPLVRPQWEFVYSCSPGFDSSAITWRPAGFSNAPLPPRR